MSAEGGRYRTPEPVYREVWDWDVVLLHGDVKVIGRSGGHLDHCAWEDYGAACGCGEGPRLSSPIVNEYGRTLRDSCYDGDAVTGEARYLLALEAGNTVEVLSGKTYRLVGPRKVEGHDSFAPASIWHVYREDPVVVHFWSRVLDRILLRRAS